jgi:EAL domain-containing protein (putative c-di-GMP-specific phosphodiesterase class I)/ActR/RegA family two-component response regulator
MTELESKGRVLLVDDDTILLDAQARHLRHAGFEVETRDSGEGALEVYRSRATQEPIEAVVTDIAMPGMNGTQLLRALREFDRDVPVILMTGAPSIESAADAVDYGALKYLLKPVTSEDLVRTAHRAVRLYRLARAKRQTLEELGNQAGEGGDRASLEASFERALESLWMAFQPILRVSSRELYGYEALLRSKEPSLPHPGAVLDAAERLGRLQELGRTIRERAVAAFEASPPDWCLFLNLHPGDLLDPELYELFDGKAEVAQRCVLEVTERASLDRIPDARERVASLRRAGCRIAIDDLGAGYAGLSSFVQLEPDLVKLDMSLVRDADKSAVKRRLIRSLTSVCQDMGMLVVAEGIETAEERDVVIDLGCELLQGYRIGRPSPPFVTPAW